MNFILVLSLAVTALMSGLSYFGLIKRKSVKSSHLVEFWLALFVQSLTMFLFQHSNPHIVSLSMMGWIWPIRAFRLVLEDISDQQLMHRWAYFILGIGGFISIALGGYGFSFFDYTLPFALAVGFVGLTLTLDAYKKAPRQKSTPLHRSLCLLAGFYFLIIMSFPLWRLETFATSFFLSEFIILIGFSGTVLSVYMEQMKGEHEIQLESLIKERNEKLISQGKYSELGMMSAGIAHEINNPLAVIQARTTQLLRIYRDSSRQKDLGDGLQQILYTSERINRTIQGVREFVHQDENGPMNDVNLKDLIDDVLVFCGQRLKNHGINLRFYNLENYTVHGNKIQLEQIVLNLLNNSFDAIEFLPDKWIEITVHQVDDKIRILIKDSGHGIPSETAKHIMEPFFSTKDLGKGTGLGLSLAKGIAEKHRGDLKYLEDVPHTTFALELPLQPESNWVAGIH